MIGLLIKEIKLFENKIHLCFGGQINFDIQKYYIVKFYIPHPNI